MEIIRNYIDGRSVEPRSGLYLDNVRPRDGTVYSRLPDSDASDVAEAVAAAKRAFPEWKAKKRQERAAILQKLANLIEGRLAQFAEAESEDQGKPKTLAERMDIPRAIENFRFFAGAILHQEEAAHQSTDSVFNYTLREPVGVAGLISPWNLPLYLLTWKLAPALATGNTVVAKPSELTPMTAYLLTQLLTEAGLPPGVCNIVFGTGARAGDALVAHPDVPLISFTGGTETASVIGQRAAPFYKKTSFELGGKNPGLIFADADLDAAVAASLRSAFLNQGEICLCTSRLLIEASIFDVFATRFVAGAKALKLGDPRQPDSFMGALVSQGHRSKVAGFVARAREQGLQILCGGEEVVLPGDLSKGFYYPPTVILAPDASPEIMQKEVFGPVVTLTPFRTYDEAIRLANQTPYGLATSIWTQNLNTAHRAARDIQAGQIWINTWMNRDLRVPFGGMKASGIGREGGRHSLEFYTEEKNVCIQI